MTTPSKFGRRGVAAATANAGYGALPPRRSAGVSPPGTAASPLLKLFFSFHGRIRRRDYWLGELSISAIMYLAIVLDSIFAPNRPDQALTQALMVLSVLGVLAVLVACVWSSLALRVKRWHDRDKSWFWIFIGFIPLLGGLWELIELGFLDGSPRENRFGRSPKWSPDVEFA